MSGMPILGVDKTLPLQELNSAESLLLTSFRLWLLRASGASDAAPDWREGFRRQGLAVVAERFFEPLLDVVIAGAGRHLAVRDMAQGTLSRDEALFLEAIRQYQYLRIAEGDLLLATWLTPAALRVASSLATRLALELEAADLILPLREPVYAPAVPVSAVWDWRAAKVLH